MGWTEEQANNNGWLGDTWSKVFGVRRDLGNYREFKPHSPPMTKGYIDPSQFAGGRVMSPGDLRMIQARGMGKSHVLDGMRYSDLMRLYREHQKSTITVRFDRDKTST